MGIINQYYEDKQKEREHDERKKKLENEGNGKINYQNKFAEVASKLIENLDKIPDIIKALKGGNE